MEMSQIDSFNLLKKIAWIIPSKTKELAEKGNKREILDAVTIMIK